MLEERAWGERRGRAPLREQTGVRGEEKKGAGEGEPIFIVCLGCEEHYTGYLIQSFHQPCWVHGNIFGSLLKNLNLREVKGFFHLFIHSTNIR